MRLAFRVGQGVDVHAFSAAPRPLRLGGVELAGPGLAGHSDADVVLHAVCDAVLGAVALGDLGSLVGVDAPATRGQASREFVSLAVERAATAGYAVGNLDCVVVAQRPRLDGERARIREGVAEAVGVDVSQVNLSATTTDRLGLIGRGEGIGCLTAVLMRDVQPSGEDA